MYPKHREVMGVFNMVKFQAFLQKNDNFVIIMAIDIGSLFLNFLQNVFYHS